MKHKTRTKTLSIMLSLAMLLSVVPGMSLTAYATPTETLLTTITATGDKQASYSTANVANVSFSTTAQGQLSYLATWGWWGYGWSATVNAAEGYTITKCVFYDDKDRTATDSEAPFIVETTEEDKTPQVNGTPILADQSKGITKIEVYGYATPAAGEDTSTYTLTIPSTLTVADKGWNATDGISATGTLADGKKLTVTASSANSWSLKQQDGSETVSYTMKETSDGAAKTAWEFTALPGSATLGIYVSDYSSKPAGTYQDTVTFTAKVENAVTAPTLAGVTLTDGTGVVIKYNCGGASTVYFKYVAASDTFVPDYASYDEACGSKYPGAHGGAIVDQNWNGGSNNFYFRKDGNTAHVYGNDGINMEVFDIQLDFYNMTYTQSYKQSYNAASGSFTSIKIGDTTITASQMTAQ